MKLENRERVDGTQITIGRRVYYRNKKKKVFQCYAVEYRDLDGKQICRNLGTKNRRRARRMAYEIQRDLDSEIKSAPEANLPIKSLVGKYKHAYEAKGVAPTTELKYKADLEKLETYFEQEDIRIARHFTENHLCLYRKWLKKQGYADKTVEGVVVLAKQMFKWAWRQRLLNARQENYASKGNLRAMGQSKIEKKLQVPDVRELVASLSDVTERAGFEPAVGQALHSLSKAAP